MQGGAGAPVVPLSNAIVIDSFPRRQTGLVSSIFGMAVVIGPVIGPTLGGYLADEYSWRWAFYMLVPVGLASVVALRFTLVGRRPEAQVRLRLDRFPDARRGDVVRAACAVARATARLVEVREIVLETIGAARRSICSSRTA